MTTQLAWATNRGITTDDRGYTFTLEENLFQLLNRETCEEYASGDGTELEDKMKALHSSSALVANVFDYWRDTERWF